MTALCIIEFHVSKPILRWTPANIFGDKLFSKFRDNQKCMDFDARCDTMRSYINKISMEFQWELM